MNQVFISEACEILGDTNNGLTGSQIIRKLKAYAYEYNIDIPYPTLELMKEKNCPNKRTALYENILPFNEEQQYIILKDLCSDSNICNDEKVKDLKAKLFIQYGKKYNNQSYELKSSSVDISEHWLDKYPRAYKVYKDAIIKLDNGIFNRNLLDDLRLSLELLLKDILHNEQSLENQNKELSNFLKNCNNSQQLINLFNGLLKSYETYHNNTVKHYKEENSAENMQENELHFIVELTNIVMRFIIENDKK